MALLCCSHAEYRRSNGGICCKDGCLPAEWKRLVKNTYLGDGIRIIRASLQMYLSCTNGERSVPIASHLESCVIHPKSEFLCILSYRNKVTINLLVLKAESISVGSRVFSLSFHIVTCTIEDKRHCCTYSSLNAMPVTGWNATLQECCVEKQSPKNKTNVQGPKRFCLVPFLYKFKNRYEH